MATVRANALIGPNLKFVKDVRIQIDDEGTITDISNEDKPTKYILPSPYLLIPGFINAHTHVGDAFLKDQTFGLSLEESVGPKGMKHRTLQSVSLEDKIESIKNSLEILVNNGFTSFFDFREEELEGVKMLEQVLEQFPLRAIILGRTSKLEILHEIFNEADGLGIADVFSIDQNLVEEVRSLKAKSPDKIVAMHVSESEDVISKTYSTYGKRDIEMACDYSIFDFLIHATYANENDFFLLKKNNINIVCCPISNLYHSLKFPPISTILKKKILLGLGTDNVLCCNPDPFRLMAFTLYNARSDNQHITPKDILKALTVNPGLMIKMKIGQIAIGYSGDLIGINLENQNLKFSKDVYSAITMRANPSDIGFQMYKGKVIKWEGQK